MRCTAAMIHGRTARTVVTLLACVWASVGAAACTVGPNYTRPGADVADTWLDVKAPEAGNRADDSRWWRTFADPVLNRLIDRAVAQNLTLRQAGLRVIEAR